MNNDYWKNKALELIDQKQQLVDDLAQTRRALTTYMTISLIVAIVAVLVGAFGGASC